MPIAKPARLTLKWWKANYPKSLPSNKELEAAIKQYEANPPAVLEAELAKVMKMEGGLLLSDLQDAFLARSGFFEELKDHLKRTKAMLTKAKHTELPGVIDDIVAMVRKDQDEVGKTVRKLQKQASGLSGTIKAKENWESRAKNIKSEYFGRLAKALSAMERLERNAKATAADASLDKKERAEALSELFGRNRYLLKALPLLEANFLKKLKSAEKDLKSDPTNLDLQSFIADAKAGKAQFPAVVRSCELLEKELVKISVAAFGDAVGKKLYLASKPVEVKF